MIMKWNFFFFIFSINFIGIIRGEGGGKFSLFTNENSSFFIDGEKKSFKIIKR